MVQEGDARMIRSPINFRKGGQENSLRRKKYNPKRRKNQSRHKKPLLRARARKKERREARV